MPQKKSHRVASRQAAASRERKKKKRAQTSQQRATVAPVTPTATDIAPPEPVTPPVTKTIQEVAPSFKYIITDLRKIGIIAGSAIIILIILGFIL